MIINNYNISDNYNIIIIGDSYNSYDNKIIIYFPPI